MFVDCCHLMMPATPKDVSVRKKQLHKPKVPLGPNRIINVGIGSLAAGEVTFEQVQPPSPVSTRPLSPMSTVSGNPWGTFSTEAQSSSSKLPREDVGPPPGCLGSNRLPSQDSANGDDIMPFKPKQTNRDMGRRKSIACMEGYLVGDQAASSKGRGEGSETPPEPTDLTVGDLVIRGPSWCWADEDGGAGGIGTVVQIDRRAQRIQVTWRSSTKTHSHYRCGVHQDLVLAPESKPSNASVSESTSEGEEEEEEEDPDTSKRRSMGRRISKELFAHPLQTFIVLDWDDTLFPTTYVRDDLSLCWQTPMRNQRLDPKEKAEITRNLDKCAENCCQLLRAAVSFGKVVLVTLARSPWVSVSCEHFFPSVGQLIQDLGVPIIYAQEGAQTDYNKTEMSSNENIEMHWSKVKGRAIAKEISQFYSQYAGQSWKNIISIGDSDFERLGTQQATEGYMKQTGICRQKTVEVSGHVYKVRTKTFKMLDLPSVDELTVELAMVHKWLPLMIQLDGSFDVNLDDLGDPVTLRRIERTLRG